MRTCNCNSIVAGRGYAHLWGARRQDASPEGKKNQYTWPVNKQEYSHLLIAVGVHVCV